MKIVYQGNTINLPDILILGAAKSGTTSLAFFLKQHPDVFMPRKEPGFFAYHDRPLTEIPSGIRARQVVSLEAYASMYEKVGPNQLICDSSVAQLTNHLHTIKNARKLYGDRISEVKAALVLRQPVDRAFSHYLMFVKNGLEDLDFEEAIDQGVVEQRIGQQLGFDYLGGSMYAERVAALKEAFPQLRIYLTEDLKNTDAVLSDFLDFCGLRQDVKIDTTARLNPSGIPKKKGMIKALHGRNKVKELMKRFLPDKLQYQLTAVKSGLLEKSIERVSIDPKLKSQLVTKHFANDINELSKVINRDLSSWL